MAAIETTYGNNGVQTNTEGLPLTSGGGLNSVLAELVRRRLTQPVVQTARIIDDEPVQRIVQVPQAAPAVHAPSPLERARERAEIIKLRQAEQGPPLRYTESGFNKPQHLEMDDQHMSAYQRQMYLPQSSTYQRGGTNTQDDELNSYEKQLQLQAQLRALYGR